MEQTEVEKLIGDLEVAIDRLRSLYEQYFMGIEKLEPTVPRKEVERRVHILRKEQIRNTALRFRFQMVLQRYSTFQSHWGRICREIENGTYKRHINRAERRFGQRPPSSFPPAAAPSAAAPSAAAPSAAAPPPEASPASPASPAPRVPGPPPLPTRKPIYQAPLSPEVAAQLRELDEDFAPKDETGVEVTRRLVVSRLANSAVEAKPMSPAAPGPRPPLAPPRPGGGAMPPLLPPRPVAGPALQRPLTAPATPSRAPSSSTATLSDDLPDQRLRQLYVQYVETKRKQNESTAAITYEAVARSLRESSAKLREKHGKPVDFEVTVRDGKAVLKPVLK